MNAAQGYLERIEKLVESIIRNQSFSMFETKFSCTISWLHQNLWNTGKITANQIHFNKREET